MRGRPCDDYPRANFVELLTERMKPCRLTPGALAAAADVNRGTLLQVLKGLRACGRKDRVALMDALKVPLEIRKEFNPGEHLETPLAWRDVYEVGDGFYLSAHTINLGITRQPGFEGQTTGSFLEYILPAWLFHHEGDLDRALRFVRLSLNDFARLIGVPTDTLLERPSECAASLSLDMPAGVAYRFLGAALYVYSSVLIERATYDPKWQGNILNASKLLDSLAEVQQRLTDLEGSAEFLKQVGHRLRLRAVLRAVDLRAGASDATHHDHHSCRPVDLAIGDLRESRKHFAEGSIDEARVVRDGGVVLWQCDRRARAERNLTEALERLSVLPNVRDVALTAYALSNVLLGYADNARRARHFGLMAAVLQPTGFMLNHALSLIQRISRRELAAEIDAVRAGEGPFGLAHSVLKARLGNTNFVPVLVEDGIRRILHELRRNRN
jgi:hypothetical protein